MAERIQRGSETHYLSYISSPDALVAMHISDDAGRDEMKYVLTDYLEFVYKAQLLRYCSKSKSSYTLVYCGLDFSHALNLNFIEQTPNSIDENYLGTIYALVDDGAQSTDDALYYSFNAWGERRELQAYDGSLTAPLFSDPADYITSHGYTGHEHIDAFNLINMNGRAYDPVVGALLSPDPYVQAPDMPQNLNRYAYCLNNPLKYKDPNGEFFLSAIFPPLVFVDIFLWGATIDYASQAINNIVQQSTMNKSIDWSDALWGDIDFLDCAISGVSDVATLGVSKITKLLKISKTGMKAINIGFKAINTYVSNSFKSQHDFTPNKGYKKYQDDKSGARSKALNLKSFTLDIAFDFAFEKIVPKKYVGSFDSKRFIDRLKRFTASTFTMPAGNEFQNRIFEYKMDESNEYIFDDENGEWIRDNTPKIPYMINFNNGGR